MTHYRNAAMNVLVLIRSCRKPPLATIENLDIPAAFQLMILADPRVYDEHRRYYSKDGIIVREGMRGLSPQSFQCYHAADREGFEWYFRLDDDLTRGFFVHKNGERISIARAIRTAYRAAHDLNVSLVGFAKTTNRFWMKPGWGRAWGLVHGGAALFRSTHRPKQYIDPELPLYDDVWQSCAHRKESGAVGRVREIGLDLFSQEKIKSATIGLQDRNQHKRAKHMILAEWSDYLDCGDGKIFIDRGGRMGLPWKFKRHADYRGQP